MRVVEASAQLGGMVRTAAVNSGMTRLALIADWLVGECAALGVTAARHLAWYLSYQVSGSSRV